MKFKKIMTPLLIILLLLSIVVVYGAPTYVNVGPTTEFDGDIGVSAGKGYYINDVLFSTGGLVDIGALAKTDGNFIVGDGTNWVAESGATARTSLGIDLSLYYLKTEIDTLPEMETIWGLNVIDSTEIDTFAELDAIVADRTLVNTTNKLSVFAATTSAELAGVISDETGSGKIVLGTEPTIVSPKIVTSINNQTGTTYTFVLTDASKLVTFGNAAAITVTIPTNANVAFPIGTQIDCVQVLAGKVTFGGANVTINSKGGNKSIAAQWVGVTLIKTDTDVWSLVGDLIV